LGGVSPLSWVVTAYILASTITTPFYGKLGDMYGRKKFFIAAIIIFLAGSALSGLSQSMAELIAFRALQGLGAGGLMVGAMATLGDIVAPRERGRYMGYMMVVMMLATIGRPLVGGVVQIGRANVWTPLTPRSALFPYTTLFRSLGDIVAPRERGRYMGYIMVVMMLATIAGPLLGGFI